MELGNLQSAIEQASATTHIREFEVAGQMLAFPRLSIGYQGAFEAEVRKVNPLFSLAATRNKAAMTMANVLQKARNALAQLRTEEGKPMAVKDTAEAKEWAEKLQAEVMEHFEPYADRIFSGITRDQMLWAIAKSLEMQYGKEVTYTVTVDDKEEKLTALINSALIDTLFSSEPGGKLENVFLWVVGLAEQRKPGEATLGPGMTMEDIAKETVGDAENSKREQDSE